MVLPGTGLGAWWGWVGTFCFTVTAVGVRSSNDLPMLVGSGGVCVQMRGGKVTPPYHRLIRGTYEIVTHGKPKTVTAVGISG